MSNDSPHPSTDYELADHGFEGRDPTEHFTLGPLVRTEGQQCERCGDEFEVGERTYLIGRSLSNNDQCCEFCARDDGIPEHLIE
jgi:hypothetical protein